ncbi:uncharacterized protein [Arachis hypogaea]|uniref:uncharacterized protein n=1 Tax=Arachis hypogaea TaxID=3818 RepID=UPI000DEC2659|nr:uncharacterized protein LOC112748194 [Arachis hypogaea]
MRFISVKFTDKDPLMLRNDVKYDCFIIGSDEDFQVLFHCHRQFPEVRTLELLAKLVDVVSSSGGENHMAEPRRITLHEQGAPDLILQPLQARYPNLDPNFELKNSLINLLPKYHGLPGQDPVRHLRDFKVACSTARRHGADEISIMVFAFPFSLEGQAKEWFYSQPDEVVTEWDLLRREFLDKFFPLEKTDYIWKEISDKRLFTASSGGSLSKNKTAAEARSLINDVAEATQHVKVRNNPSKSVVEAPSSDLALTKVLGEMTTLLKEIHQRQKASHSIQTIQAPPQILQLEGPPRVCGPRFSQSWPYLLPKIPTPTKPLAHLAFLLSLSQNPRDSINTITLRSGITLEEVEQKPIKLAEDVPNVEVGETMETDEDEKEGEVTKEEEEQLRAKESKRKNNLEEQIPIPFPTIAKKPKKHEELDPNIVQIFKNVEVTIPLFDAIHQVPKYSKFLKDVCTHKEKIDGLGMNPLCNSFSSVMDDFPEKYSDPGPCLVSCMIGEIQLKDCMCDLGSCVSIMPLSIYEKSNLAQLRRSGARFVLVDNSIILVVGIAENVLVRIQNLIFSVDFHILETPPIDLDRPSSILLGRPFLKTSQFKLDTFSGNYLFEAKGKVVKFKLEKIMSEISVNRDFELRGLSKENRKDPQLPHSQVSKAPNHGSIDKWKHLPLKNTLTKANKKDKMDVLEDVPKR